MGALFGPSSPSPAGKGTRKRGQASARRAAFGGRRFCGRFGRRV